MQQHTEALHVQFDSFYQAYYPQVLKYLAKKMSSYQDAEDLTADIFEYCYIQFQNYDAQKASLKTWLYIIVNSRYKNYLRDNRIFEDVDEFADCIASPEQPMELALEIEEQRMVLFKLLESLPDRQKEIVVLKYFNNLSSSEIADKLHMSDGNVRVLLFRAIKKMQDLLKQIEKCEVV